MFLADFCSVVSPWCFPTVWSICFESSKLVSSNSSSSLSLLTPDKVLLPVILVYSNGFRCFWVFYLVYYICYSFNANPSPVHFLSNFFCSFHQFWLAAAHLIVNFVCCFTYISNENPFLSHFIDPLTSLWISNSFSSSQRTYSALIIS